MADLVGNPGDRFSQDTAHISLTLSLQAGLSSFSHIKEAGMTLESDTGLFLMLTMEGENVLTRLETLAFSCWFVLLIARNLIKILFTFGGFRNSTSRTHLRTKVTSDFHLAL